MKTTKQERAALRGENRKWTKELVSIPPEQWPKCKWYDTRRISVWRSRDFLVQIFEEGYGIGITRISVNRTDQTPDGAWKDGITWDELQAIKSAVGYPNSLAVEIYPPDADVVNVANLRHLFVITWVGPQERFDAIIPWWKKSKEKA